MRGEDYGERSNDRIYNSILKIHEKIDTLTERVSEIRIENANLPWRLKLLERVVYGTIAVILLAVAATFDPTKNAKAETETSHKKIMQEINHEGKNYYPVTGHVNKNGNWKKIEEIGRCHS